MSMLENAIAIQSSRFSEYLAGGITPVPLGSASAVVAPSQAFLCQDKAYVAVSAETQAQWRRLTEALKRMDLLDNPRFATNAERVQHRHELADELGKVFLTKPVQWFVMLLARHKVPAASFWDWDRLSNHVQTLANQHIVTMDTGRSGVLHTNGVPWKFEEAPGEIRRNPYTGEHTEEVFAELDAGVPRAKRPTPEPDGAPPLAGLKVVELTSGLAGPHCCAYLADQGSEVTKVEFGEGDYLRQWGRPRSMVSARPSWSSIETSGSFATRTTIVSSLSSRRRTSSWSPRPTATATRRHSIVRKLDSPTRA